MAGKKYFWLKLNENFFSETYVKALRRLPSGDSLVIVYLKMQLKSLKTEGLLKYCGLLPDSTAELALALDEDENIVRLTVEALIRFKLIERWEDETLYVAAVQDLIGSEGSSAERVRKHRMLKKAEPDTCDEQCNGEVLHCNGEIEIEKDIEIELEQEKETPPISPTGDDVDVPAEPPKAKQGLRTSSDVVRQRFVRFWVAYPKKQGKGAAEKAFCKIKPSEQLLGQMLEALERAKKCDQWNRDNGQYIPNPATWLTQRRWEDDYRETIAADSQPPNYGGFLPDW